MLARLETAYLGILRVVLLVAATLALLVTIGAVTLALPALGEVSGLKSANPIRGNGLREFVDANRSTELETTIVEPTEPEQQFSLGSDAMEASKNFVRYDGRNGGEQLPQKEWDDMLAKFIGEQVPASLGDAYGRDLLRLSDQLLASKGKPLSDQRVFELIDFHHRSFLEKAAAAETMRAVGLASSVGKLVVAGGAFLIFILVLFNFIFVKIERNLRPVVQEDAA